MKNIHVCDDCSDIAFLKLRQHNLYKGEEKNEYEENEKEQKGIYAC